MGGKKLLALFSAAQGTIPILRQQREWVGRVRIFLPTVSKVNAKVGWVDGWLGQKKSKKWADVI